MYVQGVQISFVTILGCFTNFKSVKIFFKKMVFLITLFFVNDISRDHRDPSLKELYKNNISLNFIFLDN